ncbi:GtrA-like protein [mine drainage metagenome]|uniref:GtrA-like protein n=1 Tax=mine drainage metagenome TaxID=410659 RepID=A0A1J5RL81_9ZZZZ
MTALLLGQGARFLLASVANTLLGLGLFPVLQTVLQPYGVHYLITLAICHFVAVSQAYLLGRYFVFRSKGQHFWEYLLFSSYQWGYFAVNVVLLPLLIHVTGWDSRIVQFLITLVSAVLSFLWQRYVVFRKYRS